MLLIVVLQIAKCRNKETLVSNQVLTSSVATLSIGGTMAKESKSTAESPSIKKNDNVLPKKDRPSLVNTLLTYFLLVGVGAIVGYIIFYSIYNHRCSDMMDEAERRFNQTKEELNFKLIEAMYKGTTSEGAESELLELRGRLEGQTGLLGKHQALLDKHQQTVEQLSQMQTTLDRVKMRKSELSKELEISEKKLAEKEEDLNKISMQKDTLEQRLKQTTSKMEELQTQADEAGNSAACQAQKERSLSHIEKLHSSICTEKHGKGPYYVQFDMEVDGEGNSSDDPSSFVIEVPTLGQLPHSVFSFMTLVDHGVYKGAEFLSTQSIIHLDSDEESVGQLGYATSALSLAETSTETSLTCSPYSVGFVGANGGLKIIMTNDASKHGTLACFGRIAQGRQTVSRIQHAGREGKTMAIKDVTIVKLESQPTTKEGEL